MISVRCRCCGSWAQTLTLWPRPQPCASLPGSLYYAGLEFVCSPGWSQACSPLASSSQMQWLWVHASMLFFPVIILYWHWRAAFCFRPLTMLHVQPRFSQFSFFCIVSLGPSSGENPATNADSRDWCQAMTPSRTVLVTLPVQALGVQPRTSEVLGKTWPLSPTPSPTSAL